MCHPLSLTGIDIDFSWENSQDVVCPSYQSLCKNKGKYWCGNGGINSSSVCALTVYDMCKAIDKGMIIGQTYLEEKTGGKNGDFKRQKIK